MPSLLHPRPTVRSGQRAASTLRLALLTCATLALGPTSAWAQDDLKGYEAILRGESASPAAAAAPESCPAPGAPAAVGPGATTLGLIFLLGLGGAGAALVWQRRRQQSDLSTGALRHIHSLQLGQNHRVSLIEVEGRPMVVGLTQGEIKILEAVRPGAAPGASATSLADALGASSAQGAPRPADAPLRPAQAFDALLQSARAEREEAQALTARPVAAAAAAAPAAAGAAASPAPSPEIKRAKPRQADEDDYSLEEVAAASAPRQATIEAGPERESVHAQREAAHVRRGIENLRKHRKTP